MKLSLILLSIVSFGAFSSVAHAQRLGVDVAASVPNGAEIGLDLQANDHLGFRANYGYLRYADAANFQVRVGLKHIYLYGDIGVINANNTGTDAMSTYANQEIIKQENKSPTYKQALGGFQLNQGDFKMTDLEMGGGVGVKFGWFFAEAGLLSTQVMNIANNKVDVFVDKAEAYIDNNQSLTPAQKDIANQKAEQMRVNVKSGILQQVQGVPGQLKMLPQITIGFAIPII